MDNLHYRLIFDRSKSRQKEPNSCKEPFKSSKKPKFGWKMLQCVENIALKSLQIFYIIVLRVEIATTFGSKRVKISTRNTKT